MYQRASLGLVAACLLCAACDDDAADGIEVRLRLFAKIRSLGYVIPSLLGPSVNRCSDLVLGEGAVVSLGANILTSVRIGPYAMIGTGVTIGHNITIGSNCIIGGNTIVGASTAIGSMSTASTSDAHCRSPRGLAAPLSTTSTASVLTTPDRSINPLPVIVASGSLMLKFQHYAE